MKKLILSASFAFALLTTSNTFAQQGFGTNQPDKSAAVDIVSSKRGLLIPRISIADLNQAAPVHQPAHSLFVFNTNATTGQGFYYWEKANPTSDVDFSGKWVRFTSSINEKNVIVTAGDNVQVDPTTSTDGLTTTYTVGVQGGSKDGQVLVTKIDNTDPANPKTTTEWVDPNTFVLDVLTAGNAIGIALDGNGDIEIKFNGTLTEDTTIATGTHDLAITGLEDISATFDGDTHNIVVMGADGVLKITSPKSLIEDVIDNGDLEAKTLTGAGITVTAGTTAGDNTNVSVADVVLKDVTLGIADHAITNTKLADGAVSQDKMTSFTDDNGTTNPVPEGYVPVADGNGNVTYQDVATAIGEDLTTDGKIVIGNSASTVTTQADAVLVETQLSIAENSITSEDIQDGTIQPVDIAAPGAPDLGEAGDENMVLVTDENGNVTWVEQSDLANKDNYNFAAPLNKDAGTANTTGGLDYDVTIANANATTVGVVREADTDPTVNVVDGVLSVNLTNTTLSGDVTGSLNATVVEAIQGTDVSATPPTAINNVLVYDNANQEWVPTELTGAHITGEELTSNSITVTSATGTTNAALLEELNIEITPATEEGLVLTTTTGTAGSLTTSWEKPTASYSTTNVNIAGDTNYSPYIAEIILTVQLGNTDETVAFPTASAENEGQTISIKITNDNEAHTGYLNVLNTYGSMPYQGWIVKSNGSAWIIVGRN